MRGKKALKNVISTLIFQIISIIAGFIVPSLIIRTYGSSVNGLVASITQFLAYITLLESGISPVIKATLYKPIAKKNKQEIENILKSSEKFFRTIAYIFVAYIIVLCIIYPTVVNKEFDYIFSLSLILIISLSTFFEYYFGITYRVYLQAVQKTYVISNIQILTIILNTILVVVLATNNASIQLVKLGSALVYVLKPILQNIYVKKVYNLNLKNAQKGYKLKQKWDGLAQHIASVIHNNTDVAVLTICSNVKEVSVYSVYILITSGVKRISESLVNSISALFGDMLARDEKKLLNNIFSIYELIYFSIITIIFSCTLLLIVPFVQVYTRGVEDVDYYRPIFAYIMVFAEFFCMIRLPYINITYAAGHFKETRNGAWVEAIANIVISLALVGKLGIIGVALGTFVAMLIRAIEFIYHSNKYILERNSKGTYFRCLIIGLEMMTIVLIFKIMPNFVIDSFIAWIKYAILVTIISIIIVLPCNIIIYRNDAKRFLEILKNKLIKREHL